MKLVTSYRLGEMSGGCFVKLVITSYRLGEMSEEAVDIWLESVFP